MVMVKVARLLALPAQRRRFAARESGLLLNRPAFRQATILLAGANFGSGSSREQAAWALRQFGIRAVLAPSFGSIFQNNCYRNGLLPVVLPRADIEVLAVQAETGDLMLGIGRSNGMFSCPPGRTHPHWLIHRGVLWGCWLGRPHTAQPRPRSRNRKSPGHRVNPRASRPVTGSTRARRRPSPQPGGIGRSNGMFSCPPGRTHPHWVAHRGVRWGVLAWPATHCAAAAPQPELKIAWTSGKPARFLTRHRARPAPGAGPPRSPGGRAAITPPAEDRRAPAPGQVPGPPTPGA